MDPSSTVLQKAYSQPWLASFLLLVGGLTVAKQIWKALVVLSETFLLAGTSLRRFKSKEGSWAVITGASDGIGKQFAFQLAQAGFNVYLVSRNQQLLDGTAAEISAKHPQVSTKTLAIDFSKNQKSDYDVLLSAFSGLDIGVLVNNVGKSHNMPIYFVDTPRDEMDDILTVNINATLRVTYAILPGMIQRKRGLILNMGSFAASVPSPMLATYAGSKGFIEVFTSALGEEVKQHNIVVQHLNTHFVVSKLSKIRKPSLLSPTPTAYVRSVLSKIGLAGGAAFTNRPNTLTPYWSHSLLDYFIHLVGVPSLFIGYTHRLHKDIRRRALKKQEREAKQQ